MTKIFLSYSRKDLTFIERLATDLKNYGCDVWYDLSGLDGGDRWNRAIQQAIQDCQFVILVLSPDAVESKWVEKEFFYADRLKKQVIPVLHRPCDLGLAYVDLHYIEADGEKYDKNFNKILRALNVSASVGRFSNSTSAVAPAISQAKSLTYNGIEFLRVPTGKFIMGSDKYDDEKPQHTVDIPYDYWMARYPVTNEQYNAYVQANRINHPVSDWQNKKNHPVALVSWNDAMAYCKWFNQTFKNKLGDTLLRLPTEAEWEKAARGADGREFPWGSAFDKNKCNSIEGGKGGTTPVGMYSPQGDSPFGCADMTGNIWEWTHSLYKPYPYKNNDGREYKEKREARVLRGGAFNHGVRGLRCAVRDRNNPNDRNWNIGFRVVARVSSPISL